MATGRLVPMNACTILMVLSLALPHPLNGVRAEHDVVFPRGSGTHSDALQADGVIATMPQAASRPPGYITTYAGGLAQVHLRDAPTRFGVRPTAVALTGSGALLIADSADNVVWLFNSSRRATTIHGQTIASGEVTIVAGNGSRGFGGDGGPATHAALNWPQGIAVDGANNLYIADSQNGRVREVHARSGIISTVAGGGTGSNIGDGGPATQAELGQTTGVAVDRADNLYITDETSNDVREVSASSGIITTVAGTGAYGYGGDGGPATHAALYQLPILAGPNMVAVDGADNLFIADGGNHRVREVHAGSGIITTVAGNGRSGYSGDGGPAVRAALTLIMGMALDKTGNLYIVDYGNHRVREVHARSDIITTVEFPRKE